MRISCQSFSMPKAGRSFNDCEDAYFPFDTSNLEVFEVLHNKTQVFRAAVSDGATDSIFSKLWAQLLAKGYGTAKWASEISAQSIVDEQNEWLEFLAAQQLPWYAEEKAELGAFAAIVGVTVFEESNTWQALALGDCCVFQIRNGECVLAFPMTNSVGFSNFPLLLCSVAERNAKVFESKHIISDGHWQTGDQFLLMSDTVACWFLSQIENGNESEIISALSAVQSLEAFTALVSHARTTYGADGNLLMRDDDVTMTIVAVSDAASPALTSRLVTGATSPAPTSKVVTEATIARNPGNKATGDLPIPIKAKLENRNSAELPPIPQTRSRSVNPAAVDQAAVHLADDQRNVAEPPESYDSKKNFAGPSESFVAKKNFAKNSRKNSSTNRNGILAVGALFVGAVITGVVWFAPHNHKEKASPQAVNAPNSTTIKSDETTAKQDEKHHKSKWHKSKKLRPVATVAPGRSSSTQSSEQSPAVAPNVIPGQSTEQGGAGVSIGSSPPAGSLAPASGSAPGRLPSRLAPNQTQGPGLAPDRTSGTGLAPERTPGTGLAPDRMPSSAPDRAMVPNPGRSLDRNPDRSPPNIQDRTQSRGADVMPPRAPERIHLPAQNSGNPPEHAPDRMPVHLPDRSVYPSLHHPSLGAQHRRSGSFSKGKVAPPDPGDTSKPRNDLPENMNSHD